jgi:hypothetical protein
VSLNLTPNNCDSLKIPSGTRGTNCRSLGVLIRPQKTKVMGKRTPPPKVVHPITSPKIKRLSSIGERTPSKLTNKEVRPLDASVQRHIEPRGGKVKQAAATNGLLIGEGCGLFRCYRANATG